MTGRRGKRAVLTGAHQPIEIRERETPPPAPGEALVRLEYGGVCGTDVHFWHGEVALPGPVVLGHEGVGIIEELGDGLSTDMAGSALRPGDRVYWQPLRPCQRCYGCTVLRDVTLCENAFASVFGDPDGPSAATYCEYATLGAGVPFYRIPEDTSSEAVIAFGCAMPTMLQALERAGGIMAGQSVVIQGCGPVGLAATLLAHLSGAGPLIVIGSPKPRLDMALRLGASHCIDLVETATVAERTEAVLDLTAGRGADLVIEAAGVLDAFSEGLRLLALLGRYLVVGLWSAPGTVALEPKWINNRNLRIVGSALAQPRHLYQAIRVAGSQQRKYPLAETITHRFPISEAQRALEAVASHQAVKAVVIPET